MFKRPSIRYGKTPQAETPYQRAAQVWDERIGSARVQARSWRYAFFGALALSAILTGSLVWQNARGTIVPWVVEVNKLGEARSVAPANAAFDPSDPQIAFHLARFIENVRAIPDDLALDRRVRFTPTFLLVDDGRELARIEGYPGADFFWPLLGDMLATHAGFAETGN